MNISRFLLGKFQGFKSFLGTKNKFQIIPSFSGFQGPLTTLRH